MHPYTLTTQLKLGQILVTLGDCRVDMMPWCHGWVCRPPSIASHIQIGHVQSVLAPFNELCRHKSALLHCYTAKALLVLAILGDYQVEMMSLQFTFVCFSHPHWTYYKVFFRLPMRYVGISFGRGQKNVFCIRRPNKFAYKHIWPTIMFTKLSLAGWPFMLEKV